MQKLTLSSHAEDNEEVDNLEGVTTRLEDDSSDDKMNHCEVHQSQALPAAAQEKAVLFAICILLES